MSGRCHANVGRAERCESSAGLVSFGISGYVTNVLPHASESFAPLAFFHSYTCTQTFRFPSGRRPGFAQERRNRGFHTICFHRMRSGERMARGLLFGIRNGMLVPWRISCPASLLIVSSSMIGAGASEWLVIVNTIT